MAGGCMAGETATAADGMHPTGMHSCFVVFLIDNYRQFAKEQQQCENGKL